MNAKAQHLAYTIARLVASRRQCGADLDALDAAPGTPGEISMGASPPVSTQVDALASKWADYNDTIANTAEALVVELGLLRLDPASTDVREDGGLFAPVQPGS